MTQSNWHESPWDEPQRKESETAPPATLSPPKLLADGIEVAGTKMYHLKQHNKRRRIEKQLCQERGSHWTTRNGASGASYKVPTPAIGHRGQMCLIGRALRHLAAKLLIEYDTAGCPTRTGKD